MQAVRHRDRGRRHIVVAGEDRGRTRVLRQQFARRQQAGAVSEHALGDALGRYLQAFLAHGVDEGLVAQLRRRVFRVALDEGDVLVPFRQQVFGHRAGAVIVVDADGRGLWRRLGGGDRDGRHADLLQVLHRRARVAQRRRHQHAVGALGDQPLDGLALGFEVIAVLEDQFRPAAAALSHRPHQEGAEEGRAGIAVQQANAQGADARRARVHIYLVTQFIDRAHHLLAGLFADIAVAIDDARDGHSRHLGALRDIVQRDTGHLAWRRILRGNGLRRTWHILDFPMRHGPDVGNLPCYRLNFCCHPT